MEIVKLAIYYQYVIEIFKPNTYNLTLKSEIEKCYIRIPLIVYENICNTDDMVLLRHHMIENVPRFKIALGLDEQLKKSVHTKKANLEKTDIKILNHTVVGYETIKRNLENGENKDKSNA